MCVCVCVSHQLPLPLSHSPVASPLGISSLKRGGEGEEGLTHTRPHTACCQTCLLVKANWSFSSFSNTLHMLLRTTACPAPSPSPLSCSFLPFSTLVIVLANYQRPQTVTTTSHARMHMLQYTWHWHILNSRPLRSRLWPWRGSGSSCWHERSQSGPERESTRRTLQLTQHR